MLLLHSNGISAFAINLLWLVVWFVCVSLSLVSRLLMAKMEHWLILQHTKLKALSCCSILFGRLFDFSFQGFSRAPFDIDHWIEWNLIIWFSEIKGRPFFLCSRSHFCFCSRYHLVICKYVTLSQSFWRNKEHLPKITKHQRRINKKIQFTIFSK